MGDNVPVESAPETKEQQSRGQVSSLDVLSMFQEASNVASRYAVPDSARALVNSISNSLPESAGGKDAAAKGAPANVKDFGLGKGDLLSNIGGSYEALTASRQYVHNAAGTIKSITATKQCDGSVHVEAPLNHYQQWRQSGSVTSHIQGWGPLGVQRLNEVKQKTSQTTMTASDYSSNWRVASDGGLSISGLRGISSAVHNDQNGQYIGQAYARSLHLPRNGSLVSGTSTFDGKVSILRVHADSHSVSDNQFLRSHPNAVGQIADFMPLLQKATVSDVRNNADGSSEMKFSLDKQGIDRLKLDREVMPGIKASDLELGAHVDGQVKQTANGLSVEGIRGIKVNVDLPKIPGLNIDLGKQGYELRNIRWNYSKNLGTECHIGVSLPGAPDKIYDYALNGSREVRAGDGSAVSYGDDGLPSRFKGSDGTTRVPHWSMENGEPKLTGMDVTTKDGKVTKWENRAGIWHFDGIKSDWKIAMDSRSGNYSWTDSEGTTITHSPDGVIRQTTKEGRECEWTGRQFSKGTSGNDSFNYTWKNGQISEFTENHGAESKTWTKLADGRWQSSTGEVMTGRFSVCPTGEPAFQQGKEYTWLRYSGNKTTAAG